jgi:hypothetical protein
MGQAAKKRLQTAARVHRHRDRGSDDCSNNSRGESVTNVTRPLLFSSESSGEKRGGAGGGRGARPPPAAILSAESLAEIWCSVSTRRKNGRPRDRPEDLTRDLAELLRRGVPAAKIRDAILDANRDRGEQWWQFRERLTRKPARQPAALEKSTEEITREMVRRREESARLAEQAKADAARQAPGRAEG